MLKKKNVLILSLGFSLGVFVATSGSVLAERNEPLPVKEAPAALPYEELRAFTEIFGRIKNDYVEPVADKKLLEDAIRGMLEGLDPHSSYLDIAEYKELREGTSGQFGGLGIEVTMENGFVKVVSPIDDTPAQRAGIKAGDLIVKLDEKPVKGMSLTDAVKIMRGEPGSDITLTIIREGADAPIKAVVTRAIIKVKSVKSKILAKDYGYVRISSFQSRTGPSLVEAIDDLVKENNGKLKGLVLDLRNNPGGVLQAAVDVSDAFLEQGLIVYTEGRIKNSQMNFNAQAGDVMNNEPIVILINAGSASASEIVAGALQDHKRAIIMGDKSFGKGSVQTILPTSNGAAVKLTTARYYTPLGRSIQAEGIEPDIPLAKVKLESLEASKFEPIKEADLSRHLDNGNADKKTSEEKDEKDSLDLRDYALHEALNLLKGISILKK
ncbi:MAG: PDZ domain-containing protein [Methylococcaceae bacterium]|nr:PDZ domain-containing protein [Methylococcaceae bacterium]